MNKKTIITLFVLFNTVLASCQVTTTVPLNTYDYPNGAYLKDLNNELPFWEGIWEGVADNKKYIFEFTLFRQHLDSYIGGYHYTDIIKGKFKVIDLNTNQVLFNNLQVTNYEDYPISGLVIKGREFFFGFYDNEINCFNSVLFTLTKDPTNQTQINYTDFRFNGYGGPADCNYQNQSDIPMFLPRVNLVLTKQ